MSGTAGLRSALRLRGQSLATAIGLVLCSGFGCVGLWSAPALAGLPDGRVYELVSPAAEEGPAQVFVPTGAAVKLSKQEKNLPKQK
jgi:hypothetical protein